MGWGTLPTHKQAPLTLIRCLLTHLVKVFFCTRSRSSGGDKNQFTYSLGKKLERPSEVQTQWPVLPNLGLTGSTRAIPGLSQIRRRRSTKKPPHTDTKRPRNPGLARPSRLLLFQTSIVSKTGGLEPLYGAHSIQVPACPTPHAASQAEQEHGRAGASRAFGGKVVSQTGQLAFPETQRALDTLA